MRKSSYYRENAWERLKGNWGTAILICIITGILYASGGEIDDVKVPINSDWIPLIIQQLAIDFSLFIQNHLAEFATFSIGWTIISFLFRGMVNIGESRYFLNVVTGENPKFKDLFFFRRYLLKSIFFEILHTIYVTIQCIPFVILGLLAMTLTMDFIGLLLISGSIIPCIIADYSYTLAPYLLAENPDWASDEALRYSRELMEGKKMDLFMLHLSFIGWQLLSIPTLGLSVLFVTPYSKAAQAIFVAEIILPKKAEQQINVFHEQWKEAKRL